jgi:deoxyadenosine/deoxycytidine kinase
MGFERYMTGQNEFADMLCIPENVRVPYHIALEGNVGAGKSTIAKIFSETYGHPHLGEYGNYVNFVNGEKFPTFPPNDAISVMSTNPLWIKLEYRRKSHLVDSGKEYEKNLFLIERSPLSLVAFEYAKMKQGLPYEVTNLLGNYAMLLDAGRITEPSGYIFLNTTAEVVEKRIRERGGRAIDFLFTAETCSQIESFYEFFKAKYLNKSEFKDIQTDNLNPADIATIVNDFMRASNHEAKLVAFSNFCRDILTGKVEFEQI